MTSPSRLQYANERLDIERLELAAGDSSLVVSGALPLTDRAGRGEIAIEGRANLATLAQYLPAGTDLTGDGAVTVTGTLRGTLKAIDPDLVLSVDDGLVLSRQIEPGLSNIHLRARVANGTADVEQLTANWGSASIEASGRIPLEVVPPLPVEIPRMGGPATFKASVRGLDPAAIPGAPSGLNGRIDLDADAAASRADLAALEGRITFPELQVAFNGLELAQQEPSTITIASGAATIERLSLSGSAGSLATTGNVGLAGERPLNLDVDGDLQIAAVSALTERVRAEGAARLNVAARGTLTAPELNGTVALADATLVSDEPNVAAENIAAELTLAGSRVELTRLSADVNGGTLEGSGTVALGAGTVSDIDLQFTARDVAYDAPLDLRSLSDSTIRVTRRGDDILVSGQVTIDEAGQTADINFDEGLLAAINARPTLDLTEERNPLLERVRFNVDVDTATPILVENNLAHAEVDVDVRVVGTPYEPGLTGRLNLLEGAEITLNERRYEAERGVITFVDERRIVPSVDLLLNTSAGNYDITIAVTGEPGQTETTLTSAPSLPEPDIMAMLVTGRTLDEMRGEEYEVAREQVLSYLAGRLGSRLGRGIERATGLSEVRVEPQLIANETDPAARLTVGQELTDELKLVYSTNLADSNDQIWVAEYDVTRRFQTQTVRQSDNSYRFDFRHDVRFGGEPEPRRQPRHRPTIARLAVTTDSGSEDPALRERFNLKEGDSYDFFAVRRGVERIEETFLEQGYLQSRVRLERKVEGDSADLTLRVVRGPLVELRFEGATPPANVQEDVRVQWHRGVFDKQRGDDSADALRAWLMGDDHLQPRVDYEIVDEGDDRRAVVFRIQPGPRYRRVLLAFEGASGIDPDQLDAIIDQQKLERQLFTDPVVVTALLERYYREQGFLSATIDEPRYEFQGDTARVVMTVNEGPRFTVRSLTASGNSVFTTDELVSGLPLVAGDLYLPSAAEHSLERIRDFVLAEGLQRPSLGLRPRRRSSGWPGRCGVHPGRGSAERHRGDRHRRHGEDLRASRPRAGGARDGAAARSERAREVAPQSLRHRRVLDRRYHARGSRGRRTGVGRCRDGRRCHAGRGAEAGAAERLRQRGAALSAALWRVLRQRARARRHRRHLESQLARQGARARPAVALRRPAARGAGLHQPALAALLAAQDDRQRLHPRRTEPADRSHRSVRRQPQGRLDPAGDGAPRCVRLELRVSLRASHDAPAVARRRHHRDAHGVAADGYAHARDARRSARRLARRVPVAGLRVLAGLARLRSART